MQENSQGRQAGRGSERVCESGQSRQAEVAQADRWSKVVRGRGSKCKRAAKCRAGVIAEAHKQQQKNKASKEVKTTTTKEVSTQRQNKEGQRKYPTCISTSKSYAKYVVTKPAYPTRH